MRSVCQTWHPSREASDEHCRGPGPRSAARASPTRPARLRCCHASRRAGSRRAGRLPGRGSPVTPWPRRSSCCSSPPLVVRRADTPARRARRAPAQGLPPLRGRGRSARRADLAVTLRRRRATATTSRRTCSRSGAEAVVLPPRRAGSTGRGRSTCPPTAPGWSAKPVRRGRATRDRRPAERQGPTSRRAWRLLPRAVPGQPTLATAATLVSQCDARSTGHRERRAARTAASPAEAQLRFGSLVAGGRPAGGPRAKGSVIARPGGTRVAADPGRP